MPSSRGSSGPRDQTRVSYISCSGRRVLYHQLPLHIGLPFIQVGFQNSHCLIVFIVRYHQCALSRGWVSLHHSKLGQFSCHLPHFHARVGGPRVWFRCKGSPKHLCLPLMTCSQDTQEHHIYIFTSYMQRNVDETREVYFIRKCYSGKILRKLKEQMNSFSIVKDKTCLFKKVCRTPQRRCFQFFQKLEVFTVNPTN